MLAVGLMVSARAYVAVGLMVSARAIVAVGLMVSERAYVGCWVNGLSKSLCRLLG